MVRVLVFEYLSIIVKLSLLIDNFKRSFVPVTGGSYVRSAPSKQLWSKKIVGQRLLVSVSNNHHFLFLNLEILFLTDEQTNANEGAYLVPSNIKTLDDLTNWLQNFYPSLNDDDINDILHAYPSTSAPVNPLDPKFATPGYGPATAVNVSQIGTGQQQRAYVGVIKKFIDQNVNRSRDTSVALTLVLEHLR